MFRPERNASMSPDEDKMIELCCNSTPMDGKDNDDQWAAELDKVLQAAKDKGKPCNLELKTTSGATPLVMAALSNGPARVRVLLKHGKQLDCKGLWDLLHSASSTGSDAAFAIIVH
jgi:hypothetical protein